MRIDRRFFLKTGSAGGTGFWVGFQLGMPSLRALAVFGEDDDTNSFEPNAFIHIDADGSIRLTVNKSEMGQGVRTSLPMILAEELEADLSKVRIVQANSDRKYGNTGTGGSRSIRSGYMPLRRAAATARETLKAAAAKEWGVDPSECVAELGSVRHEAAGHSLSYGELAAKAAALPALDPETVKLKESKDFSIIGTRVGRLDNPDIVTGRAVFGLDKRLPGMLFSVVERPAVVGGTVRSFQSEEALKVPGVRKVFAIEPQGRPHNVRGGVAVVADTTWAAMKGRRALKVEWDDGPHASETSESLRKQMLEALGRPGREIHAAGDVDKALQEAAKTLESVYQTPYLSHSPMEPMNAVAAWSEGRCEVWAPTQFPSFAQRSISQVCGIEPSSVEVNVTLLGGGFGRRINPDVPVEAALIARKAGAPVQVVWSREDDMQCGYYRPASAHRLTVGLDQAGKPTAWRHRLVTPAIQFTLAGPNARMEGNEVGGARDIPYRMPNFKLEYTLADSSLYRGWWRSVEHSFNAFAVQSFVDEIASMRGKDPLDNQIDLIGRPHKEESSEGGGAFDSARLLNVLRLATDKAGWGKKQAQGRALGLAVNCAFGTYCAQVAQVSADDDGAPRVHRVVCAVDCGTVVNPDMVEAQAEGGIIFGLTAALKGTITVDKGRVEQSNFDDYPLLRIDEIPKIEIHLIASTEPPSGMGEPCVPPIAPAVANALFALTGKRVRRLPILTVA